MFIIIIVVAPAFAAPAFAAPALAAAAFAALAFAVLLTRKLENTSVVKVAQPLVLEKP